MTIWAIGDLHLAISVPDKTMEDFGEGWRDYANRIATEWKRHIQPDDLCLIPGDICWAMRVEEAAIDLQWIHELPGTKVMIRGNHDYWWTSLSKVEKVLPPSIHLIQHNAFVWKDVVIGGARLWDSPEEYRFHPFINYIENKKAKKILDEEVVTSQEAAKETEKIFVRELNRLEMSLKAMEKHPDKKRIVMTHYPPISADLKESRVSKMLEKYGVKVCVFGHLHNVKQDIPLFGEKGGVRYFLTSADYLNFSPLRISVDF